MIHKPSHNYRPCADPDCGHGSTIHRPKSAKGLPVNPRICMRVGCRCQDYKDPRLYAVSKAS